MKMVKTKSVVRLAVAGTLLGLCISGCGGKKDVDYSMTEEGGTGQEVSVPETLNYEVDAQSSGGKFVVDADVIYNAEASSVPVVTLERADFTEEQMKQIADDIFGAGNYEVTVPYIYWDRDSLSEEQERIQDEAAGYGAEEEVPDELADASIYVEQALDSYGDNPVLEWDESVRWLTVENQDEGQDVAARTYSFCTIRGKIDDATYSLVFQKDDACCCLRLVTGDEIQNFAGYTYGDCPYENVYSDAVVLSKNGNPCIYTKEESVELAENFMNQAGFTDYAVNAVYDAHSYIASGDEDSVNGYIVYFGRQVKNMTTVYYDWQDQGYMFSYDENLSYGYEDAWVYVSDSGITECGVQNPMSVKEINTENAVLLPFDNADELAQDYMQTIAEKVFNSSYSVEIDEVEFGLGRVSDENGDSYALIPMWYYFINYKKQSAIYAYREPAFAVNALDGSIIDVSTGETAENKTVYKGRIVEY